MVRSSVRTLELDSSIRGRGFNIRPHPLIHVCSKKLIPQFFECSPYSHINLPSPAGPDVSEMVFLASCFLSVSISDLSRLTSLPSPAGGLVPVPPSVMGGLSERLLLCVYVNPTKGR